MIIVDFIELILSLRTFNRLLSYLINIFSYDINPRFSVIENGLLFKALMADIKFFISVILEYLTSAINSDFLQYSS